MRRPVAISTFSGCGGSSFGYKLAGFDVRLAVEWDAHAVATYRLNHTGTEVFHGDISTLSVDQALSVAHVRPGELDLFDGSPPCQGFSTAGKRDTSDSRNQLFRQYVRLLRGLQPKCFVMENVKGMTVGVMRPIFFECLKELRDCGYKVEARVLNAWHYGVPQSRQRVIFVGIRHDIDATYTFPAPTVDRPITCSQALKDVKAGPTPVFGDAYAQLWARIPPGKSASTVLHGSGFNGCVKLHPHKPSPTIPKTNTGRGFATIAHWETPRAIAINEMLKLSSFPADMKWPDNDNLNKAYVERSARIGNSVPPLLTAAVARNLNSICMAYD